MPRLLHQTLALVLLELDIFFYKLATKCKLTLLHFTCGYIKPDKICHNYFLEIVQFRFMFCHPIFNKREIGSTVIKNGLKIIVWVFNKLGLKRERVPLNIPQFTYFTATRNFYTHPNNVPGIFPCYIHIAS